MEGFIMEESKEAREARLAYLKAWKKKNAKHLKEYRKKWNAENRDKVRASQARYWERKAAEKKANNS